MSLLSSMKNKQGGGHKERSHWEAHKQTAEVSIHFSGILGLKRLGDLDRAQDDYERRKKERVGLLYPCLLTSQRIGEVMLDLPWDHSTLKASWRRYGCIMVGELQRKL